MDTPHLPRAIFGSDFKDVYEPAEDTFLLLDALEKDLETLKKNVSVCLECGSGSGVVITAVSKALKTAHLMIATDVNPSACKTTRKCALHHSQGGVQVIQTSFAESLVDRLENEVDLLIFNPPYVPTEHKERDSGLDNPIALSWAGGDSGRQLINIFLKSYVPRLLRRPSGVAYMIALDRNDIHELLNYLVDENRIRGSVVIHRRAGIENLYVIKYEWIE